jgi:hypothetical protein
MSLSEDQADFCPYCRRPFEIVHVKFRLNGSAIIARCPNCGMAFADAWPAAERHIRHVLALLIGALAIAALLRHFIHTYGGIPREEIRSAALLAIPIIALAIVFFRRKRQLRRNEGQRSDDDRESEAT